MAQGRIRRGLEQQRHIRQVLRSQLGQQLHPGRQTGRDKAVIAAHARAGEVLEQGHAATARHRDELPVVRIVDRILGRSKGQARLRGGELDPVDELGPAALQVIADAEHVVTIRRHRDFEARIQATHPAPVIVGDQGGAGGAPQADDRIQGRPKHLGVSVAREHLALLQSEAVVIRVAGRADDAIQRVGVGGGDDIGLLAGAVRFRLEEIIDGGNPEGIPRRRRRFGREHLMVRVLLGRYRDRAGKRALGVDETHVDFRARLAARGEDHVRTAEVADMQTIEGARRTTVGRLADHHEVIPVVLRDEGTKAVLPMQDRVIGRRLLEPILVEDRDVRIEVQVPQTQAIDLEAEPLALLHRDLEVIHILGEDDAFDRAVRGDDLGLGELRVRLLLLDRGIGADEELARMGQARPGAHAHQVTPQGGVGGDRDGQVDLARGHGIHAFDGEPRIVEQERLEVLEARPRHGQLEFGATLTAVGLAGGELGVSRAQARRQAEQNGKETKQHGGRSGSRGTALRRATPA